MVTEPRWPKIASLIIYIAFGHRAYSCGNTNVLQCDEAEKLILDSNPDLNQSQNVMQCSVPQRLTL